MFIVKNVILKDLEIVKKYIMKNSLYNVDQIVKISKNRGGWRTAYKYFPNKFITIFGKTFKISNEDWRYGAFSVKRENIEENDYIFKGFDGNYYQNPFIEIKFTNNSIVEIPFKTIQEMEEKFNWWKDNHPNLIEL